LNGQPNEGFLSTRLSLILALVLAVIAAVLAYLSLYGREQKLDKKWNPVKVLVAAKPIQKGEELRTDNVAFDEVPQRFLLGSAVPASEFENLHVIGQRVSVDFAPGDPILTNLLSSDQTGSGAFSDTVAKKARAISVRVSPESSIQNMVRPGDRVDVIVTFRDPNGTENITTTLLENVWVLATGNLTGRDSFVPQSQRTFATLTLQVLPEAAELLVLAQTLGTLYFTLRNPEDSDLQDNRAFMTNMKTLVSGERSKLLSKQQTKVFPTIDVQVIKGTKSEVQHFPGNR